MDIHVGRLVPIGVSRSDSLGDLPMQQRCSHARQKTVRDPD